MDKNKNNVTETVIRIKKPSEWYDGKISHAYEGPSFSFSDIQSSPKDELKDGISNQLHILTSVINQALMDTGVEINMRLVSILNEKTDPIGDKGYLYCRIIKPK